jgi:hypothetical protein
MCAMNPYHNPEYRQVLDYQEELLKEVQHEALVREALKARREHRASSNAVGFLRRLFARRRSQDFAKTASDLRSHS